MIQKKVVIAVSPELRDRLQLAKLHVRETYGDVLDRCLPKLKPKPKPVLVQEREKDVTVSVVIPDTEPFTPDSVIPATDDYVNSEPDGFYDSALTKPLIEPLNVVDATIVYDSTASELDINDSEDTSDLDDSDITEEQKDE